MELYGQEAYCCPSGMEWGNERTIHSRICNTTTLIVIAASAFTTAVLGRWHAPFAELFPLILDLADHTCPDLVATWTKVVMNLSLYPELTEHLIVSKRAVEHILADMIRLEESGVQGAQNTIFNINNCIARMFSFPENRDVLDEIGCEADAGNRHNVQSWLCCAVEIARKLGEVGKLFLHADWRAALDKEHCFTENIGVKGSTALLPRCCATCNTREEKRGDYQCCARCRRVAYCSRKCQKAHWKIHKQTCVPKKVRKVLVN